MNKKLIERARKAHTSLGESLHFGLCAELADRVEELEQQLEQAHADIAGLHDQLEEPQITQDEYKLELEQLRQQVTLLRGAMEAAWQDGYAFCGSEGLSDAQKQFQAAFAATESKP